MDSIPTIPEEGSWLNWSKKLTVGISYYDITSDKALWTEATLECLRDNKWLTDDAIVYGLNRIVHQAQRREDCESSKRVVILPITYWREFIAGNHTSQIDFQTSKLLPRTLKFYDIIFVPVNVTNNHWVAYAYFPKVREIIELNSLHGLSANKPLIILHRLLQYWSRRCLDQSVSNVWRFYHASLIRDKLPKQFNGYDCGIYTLLFAQSMFDRCTVKHIDSRQVQRCRWGFAMMLSKGIYSISKKKDLKQTKPEILDLTVDTESGTEALTPMCTSNKDISIKDCGFEAEKYHGIDTQTSLACNKENGFSNIDLYNKIYTKYEKPNSPEGCALSPIEIHRFENMGTRTRNYS